MKIRIVYQWRLLAKLLHYSTSNISESNTKDVDIGQRSLRLVLCNLITIEKAKLYVVCPVDATDSVVDVVILSST